VNLSSIDLATQATDLEEINPTAFYQKVDCYTTGEQDFHGHENRFSFQKISWAMPKILYFCCP
jgi:hypothetical protein